MEIQQGFNRIGISVAIAFVGLSIISLIFAATNYIEYRSEIAIEYKKFFGIELEEQSAFFLLHGPEEKMRHWNKFKEFRYRSVGESLQLSKMCLASSVIALLFWFLVGRAYVTLSHRLKLSKVASSI